jgi:tetratricopeptide (TPR) repeat protein
MKLFEEGDVGAARMQLTQLAKHHPGSKPVLYALLVISMLAEDWHIYAYYGEQILPLESGLDQAETLNNLAYAYTELVYPALAWYFAKELSTLHPDYEHAEQARAFVEKTESFLLDEAAKMANVADFTQEEKLDILIQHDRVRFYTQSGHPEESIAAARTILEKVPEVVPILNNLSLSQFMVGDLEQAKETAQKVLAKDPDNFHALANLVRFNFLTAQFDQAHDYALRLQQITSDNPDLETKQAEAFAFLGEDEQVQAAYKQAKEKYGEASFLLLHLAAAASYRLGDEKEAWRLWRRAVKLAPSFEMAQESLAEKSLPVGKRDIPWYWPLQYWFSENLRQSLVKFLGTGSQKMSEKAVERGMKSLLEERPYFPQLFPYVLEYGDRAAREFVINFIRIVETPELIQVLFDFAHGRYGADDIRLEAMQFITEHYPEMLPEDKRVKMWVNGQQTELFMLGFEITDETEVVKGVSNETQDKHETAYEFLMEDDPESAELLLKEVIDEAPHFYSAYNQLAVAYQMQGQHEKARALIEETHARFPDYLFARVALARMLVQDKQTEEARELLEPLMRLQKLHISEFRALAIAQIEIALAANQSEGARMWLDMWEQIDEGNPQLMNLQMRVKGPGLMKGLQSLLGRSRP